MGYCTVADVQAEFKNLEVDNGTFITTSGINGFIAESSALIDGKVGQRWQTPVTGEQSLLLMSLFCRTMVAARVRGILANKQVTNVDPNMQVRADGLTVRDVMKMLEDIKNGDMQLADAVILNADTSMFSNNFANGIQPRFQRGVKSW